MGEGQLLEILIWACFAAFIGMRLRNVLGRRTGHERKPPAADSAARFEDQAEQDNVVSLSGRGAGKAAQDSPWAAHGVEATLGAVLGRLGSVDRNFEPESFLDGARKAYRMVVSAFASGDRETLRPLLGDQVFEDFSAAIEAREKAGETAEVNISGATQSEYVDASLHSRIAKITVRFVSDLIRFTRDAQNRVIEGNDSVPRQITDIWTFERDVGSSNPNWVLVSTSSAD